MWKLENDHLINNVFYSPFYGAGKFWDFLLEFVCLYKFQSKHTISNNSVNCIIVYFLYIIHIFTPSLFIILMNRIKEVLEQKGIKQVWLADQLGKSYNIVNGYVQNRSQPSVEILYKIAEILDVDVKELLISTK